jgi:hypothetical protein
MEQWEGQVGEVLVKIESEGLKAINKDGDYFELSLLRSKDVELVEKISKEEMQDYTSIGEFIATFTCGEKSCQIEFPLIDPTDYEQMVFQTALGLVVEMYDFIEKFPTIEEYLKNMGTSLDDPDLPNSVLGEYNAFSTISNEVREVLSKEWVDSLKVANHLSE